MTAQAGAPVPVPVVRYRGGRTIHLLTEVFSGDTQPLVHARVACYEVGLWRRATADVSARARRSKRPLHDCDRCAATLERAVRQPSLPGIGGAA